MSEDFLKNFKYKKALVTGGAGFIGSHIVEELLKLGVDVISVDDYSSGKKANLHAFQTRSNFKEAHCDVTDMPRLRECFEGVDIVFHNAASKKNICLKDPRRDLEVNAKGTFNILELSREFGVKKVVHASTGSVYGEAIYYPQDEKHPLSPTSFYGVSKLAGEKYAMVISKMYGLDVTILRYFHVYGPRQDYSEFGGVVSIFFRQVLNGGPIHIFGDGTQQRSFTYVKDVVRINLLAACSDKMAGEVYNCASGIRITIRELAEKVKVMLNRPKVQIDYGDWTPGDIKVFIVDNSKLRSLGFDFEVDFDTGLQETVVWMKKNLGK